MKFDFVQPKPPTLRERRHIRRGLQEKLIARAAARLGKEVTGIVIENGQCFARLKNGDRVRFDRPEEEAWQHAIEWEQTGAGEVPKLPIRAG